MVWVPTLKSKFLGVRFDFWIIVLLFLFYSFLYSLLSITRHNHFQSQGIDFSIYDQALWLYGNFHKPFSTITNHLDLADRFRPIMVPLSALFWFTKDERILLFFQAVIISAGVFPIWLLARRVVPQLVAVVIAFLYVDFVGIQSLVAYDFHEMAVLPVFLGMLFYFLHAGRWLGVLITLFLCLLVREHVGLLLAPLGIFIYLFTRNIRKALAVSVISLAWSISAIKFMMPAFGQETYIQFVNPGDTFGEAVLNYVMRPDFAIVNFLLPAEKVSTLFWSFLSFGFFPLAYFAMLPVIFFQFASRFLDLLHPIRWTPYYHYSAELAVFFSVSTIYFSAELFKKFSHKFFLYFVIFFLLGSHAVANFTLHAPLNNLLKRQFYFEEPWVDQIKFIINRIPREASVASQNNLLPHLSHRKEIYLLPENNNADYIVVDLHEGKNNWNFYSGNLETARKEFSEFILSGKYKILASYGSVYLLQKKG